MSARLEEMTILAKLMAVCSPTTSRAGRLAWCIAMVLLAATSANADPPTFTDVGQAQLGGSWSRRIGVIPVDVDRDGDNDLITSGDGGTGIRILLNDGRGTFTAAPNNAGVSTTGEGHMPVPADVNDDGWTDFALVWWWNDGNIMYRNDGDGTFTKYDSGIDPEPNGQIGAFGDVDGDGDQDFWLAVQYGLHRLYLNAGDGIFTDGTTASGFVPAGNRDILAMADWDNDGDLDMSTGYTWWANDGDGNYTNVTNITGITGGNGWTSFGDIDNDGYLDVLNGNKLWANDGDGTFTNITALTGGGFAPSGVVADFNNDGWQDILVKNQLWLNDGDRTFTLANNTGIEAIDANCKSYPAADVDGDGDLDVISSDKQLFRNNLNDDNWLVVNTHTAAGATAIGAKVSVYSAGHLGESAYLLGYREQDGDTYNHGGGQPTSHFGLPNDATVDVRVEFLSGNVRALTAISRGENVTVLDILVPEIDITGNGVSIPDGDSSPSPADHSDFSSADIATGAVSRTFTIANSGTGDLDLTGTPKVALSGADAADYSVTAQPSTPVGSGGGTTTFTVQFDPSTIGLRLATVSIDNSDGDEDPYDFAIQGTGTAVVPSITAHPQSVARDPGASATFSVTATGTATLTYQWRKDASNISNATSASYTIASVQESDEGDYDCIVSNLGGFATSNAAILTVNDPPTITAHPQSLIKDPGDAATFSIAATGTGPLTYQWRKGGNNISGAVSASYTLASVQESDEGIYDCVVTNSADVATSNAATLTVNDPPAITA